MSRQYHHRDDDKRRQTRSRSRDRSDRFTNQKNQYDKRNEYHQRGLNSWMKKQVIEILLIRILFKSY